MSEQIYGDLVASNPAKMYTEHRLGFLMPYFKGDKTLQEIADETGLSARILKRWLNDDFSELGCYIAQLQEGVEAPLNNEPNVNITQHETVVYRETASDLFLENMILKARMGKVLANNAQLVGDSLNEKQLEQEGC